MNEALQQYLMLGIQLVSALIIFSHGVLFVLNKMSDCTHHGIRWAWLILTTGSVSVLLAPLYGNLQATLPSTIIIAGAALYALWDRRCFTNCPLDKERP